jgi:glycosidase
MYGTLADFDKLSNEAHQRGIHIILDLVVNHTSDQHKWFLDSKSSKSSAKRDWYIWRDGKGPGQPPNNWTSTFGGSAWKLDPTTGQYYYHYFYPEQPDLNWRNPAVERAMFDVTGFWYKRGVAGLRWTPSSRTRNFGTTRFSRARTLSAGRIRMRNTIRNYPRCTAFSGANAWSQMKMMRC